MYAEMELDYDPFLEAQDCDESVLENLRIEKDSVRTDVYRILLWDNFNGNTGKPNCCSGTGRTDTGSTHPLPAGSLYPRSGLRNSSPFLYLCIRNNYSVNPKTLL